MKIGVITTCFNEETILPFFLSHYQGWDDILVLLDRDTTDGSESICRSFPNVTVEKCGMTAGLHELEKVAILQKGFDSGVGHFDWLAVLDSDELIIPFYKGLTPHQFLNLQSAELVISVMFPVYRHVDDNDLDPRLPALPQRLHGRKWRSNEVKPNVLRATRTKKLTIGMHTPGEPILPAKDVFLGAHWADADPIIAKARRISRRNRFSKENLERGWGVQHFDVTEQSLDMEAREHLLDPLLKDLKDRI